MRTVQLVARALLSLIAFLVVVASSAVLVIALLEKNLFQLLASGSVFTVALYGLMSLSSAEYRERKGADSETL